MARSAFLSDTAFGWRWFREPGKRRLILAVLAVVLALLTFFPRPYVANVKLVPQDSGASGLGSLVGQFGGNVAAILTGRSPVEINLTIGRSFRLQSEVAVAAGLVKRGDAVAMRDAVRSLDRHVSVRALRAGVIEIEAKYHDPDQAVRVATSYARGLQARLAELSRATTENKRKFVESRLGDSQDRLNRAQAAITAFRQQNQLVSPNEQFSAAVSVVAGLQTQLQSKEIELESALRFNSEQSFRVRSLRAEMNAIRRQLQESQIGLRDKNGPTAVGLGNKAFQYTALTREFTLAQSLMESYKRLLEGAALEQLTADFNMQIVDPTYLKPGTQFNTIPLVLFALIVMIALAAEFYVFRPPLGARRAVAA